MKNYFKGVFLYLLTIILVTGILPQAAQAAVGDTVPVIVGQCDTALIGTGHSSLAALHITL